MDASTTTHDHAYAAGRTLSLPPDREGPARVELEVLVTAPRERRERAPATPPVDFSHVPAEQRDMHARLENWAKSCDSPQAAATAPGFDLYRSDAFAERSYGAPTVVSVNRDDAKAMSAAIALLATRPRLILAWYYVRRGRDPAGAARVHHLSLPGLAAFVIAARQQLIDGGA
jgi:hypothetical protein